MLAPNTILQNRYRVLRELGHGGMGTVYEALDQRVSCIVALKETSVNNSNEARSAFEHEAALLANLRHLALPKVMDYFSEGEGDFLVMEFIPGVRSCGVTRTARQPIPSGAGAFGLGNSSNTPSCGFRVVAFEPYRLGPIGGLVWQPPGGVR